MALVMKYRLGEVAKDFGVPNKDIAAIMAEYFAPSKNHMQVLANEELDVIFEYMTQHNQVASLEEIFQVPAPAAPAAEPEKEKADKADGKPAQDKQGKAAQPKAEAQPRQDGKKPQSAPGAQQAPAAQVQNQPTKQPKSNKPFTPRQVAEKRVVDTRGGSAVNIDKYNEKYEDLGGNKANSSNMRRSNKEKIQSKSKQRANPQAASAKRRQEERDKMARLHLEIARKQQLKVEIPDEIAVGELAS
jgi:translation initiation factor IF-2